jgi:tetratricopeptide (TPR) repeat protein
MTAASHSPAPSHRTPAHPPDAERRAALEQYEAGMKYYGQQKFDKAKSWLEKAAHSSVRDVAERAGRHLAVCEQKLQSSGPTLRSAEDYYNAAIWRLNLGQYEEAQEHLERAQKLEGKTGHTEYALAAVYAQRNDADHALEHLKQAVTLDPRNRLLARSDADFKSLMEDPRFTEEIYPD